MYVYVEVHNIFDIHDDHTQDHRWCGACSAALRTFVFLSNPIGRSLDLPRDVVVVVHHGGLRVAGDDHSKSQPFNGREGVGSGYVAVD